MVNQIKIVTVHSDLKKKVINFAITSRLFVLLFSFVSNILLPDHDAGVFKLPQPALNSNLADRVVNVLFGGLARWDAQYFLHITFYGYTYENTLAFFPLFPLLTRILAYVLEFIVGNILNSLSVVLISAMVLNFLFFVNAATALFELSCYILKDEKFAYISALLFCANPASIFFSAAYSESCFSYLTFSGMLISIKNNNEVLSSVACGLSACARSNGLLNLGFLAHKTLKNIVYCLTFNKPILNCMRYVIIQLIQFSICTAIFFVPFLLFQVYTYKRFCIDEANIPSLLKNFGEANGYILPGSNKSPWCNFSIPFSYSYVQNHYWDVGFLKYYELKQIPNFLLASPIIFLVLRNSYVFIKQNKSSLRLLGLNDLKLVMFQNRVLRPEFFVFVVHALCLTVFCMLFINVQVSTRMIASSCPIIYWFVTLRYWSEPGIKKGNHTEIESRLDKTNLKFSLVESKDNIESFWKTCLITEELPNKWFYGPLFYFISYLLIGTALFSNFYPWT